MDFNYEWSNPCVQTLNFCSQFSNPCAQFCFFSPTAPPRLHSFKRDCRANLFSSLQKKTMLLSVLSFDSLSSKYLWIFCATLRRQKPLRSPEVFSVVANCLLPLSDSKNQTWYLLGWVVRLSLAITSCLVNKLSSKTVSCQELWSSGE